jgi:hypothetical protein
MGSAIATVRAGQAEPDVAIAQMHDDLQVLADTAPPV